MALTHGDHLPVLFMLHVVVHNLLEPRAGARAHLTDCPWKFTWIFLSLEVSKLLQFPLFIEVKDSILEVMHLAENQRLVKDIAETATFQQGDGLCMKLLFDLGKKDRAAGNERKIKKSLEQAS